jgi:hypothetical protein
MPCLPLTIITSRKSCRNSSAVTVASKLSPSYISTLTGSCGRFISQAQPLMPLQFVIPCTPSYAGGSPGDPMLVFTVCLLLEQADKNRPIRTRRRSTAWEALLHTVIVIALLRVCESTRFATQRRNTSIHRLVRMDLSTEAGAL